MPLPISFVPAATVIYEALTTERTTSRALPADRLFRRLAARRDDASTAAQVIAGPLVLVVLRDLQVAPGPEMAPSDRLRYTGLCEVTRYYHAANDLFSEEMERARLRAADDLHLVRAALCWPGALATTDGTAEATGIDGGALMAVGHRSTGPSLGKGFLQWTDLYPISISLSAP